MTVAGSAAVIDVPGGCRYSLVFRLCIDFDESSLPWQLLFLRIAQKFWLVRIGIRIAVLSIAIIVVFILVIIFSI
ncbi:hypothetical protein [Paenibacillus lautus]|uniref:hypothetical protein n=1 Tax=Paenibacillus lautus TaxID=1401 RepID=UPI001C109EF1|nr:hypothetical protein [Paenibacillus lautus]MBU5348434.1 hypothetical protein [Paenibacillus lautus]